MSAAPAAANVARAAARPPNRYRAILARRAKALQPRKPLQYDSRTGLPIPHVNIVVQDTRPSRGIEHYYNTVRDDLMYMTYTHQPPSNKPERKIRLAYDPEDPYVKHRYNPPVGGPLSWTRQAMVPVTHENVVKLERIQLHTMLKDAVQSKSHILGAMMAFRAISGNSAFQGGQRFTEGVQVTRGKKAVQGWTRKGAPIGVKVDLKGPQMYEFMAVLTQCVLPRWREFTGVPLVRPSASMQTPAGASGVVSFGLPPSCMAFFPQIEYNLDAYPKSYGMHIHFITNAQGEGAQNRVAALLSGFQIPFARA